MKRIMQRSFLILIVSLVFFGGICFLAFRLLTQNSMWVQQPYNGHMSSSNGLAQAGDIVDRDGAVLAHTDASKNRVYHEDLTTREALLHVVGDNSLNISTAVQSSYRNELTNYSFIWGLGMPNSLKSGKSLALTVDAGACRAAYEALGSHKGACVIYNYKTGEVLCSTSTLSYDPENPPEINEDNEEQYDGVYLDNTISSTFTPGSIFKIVTAAAAIKYIPDIYEQSFYCEGEYEIEGSKITCEEYHGYQNFDEAFSHSCNCAFAQIALQVGRENLTKTAEELGFNKELFMDDIALVKSHYDVSQAGDNELAWSGIGQYTDLSNPMHMAMLCGSIATGGTAKAPYLIQDHDSFLAQLGIEKKAADVQMLDANTSEQVKVLMRNAANYYYNARGLDLAGLNFCAKTGTAEIGEDKEPNAGFVGFTEDDAHPYAFAAVVAEGGYGISAAASVVSAAMYELVY
ncbi:MAG: penicillin-binding protein [Ruminococcus sp.]|nr:penicillin-binding protein [Ruminococcus sp.]